MEQFQGIERETGDDPSLSLIWLHGLGADASDFLPIIGELELPVATRFVFPNAPQRRVTINGGVIMRAWYDIKGFGPRAPEDVAGLTASVDIVGRLIQRELDRGVAAARIILVGFSQGGAVAQHAGLTTAQTLGGVVGLSTYLPAAGRLAEGTFLNTSVPMLLMHGSQDPVIPIEVGKSSVGLLSRLGIAVDWAEFPMAHEVCRQQIGDLSDWVRRIESR